MPLTVVTNLHALERVSRPGVDLRVIRHERPAGRVAQWRAARRALAADYVVVNCSPLDLFYYAAFKAVMPFSRARLVSMDTVLPVPRQAGLMNRLTLAVKRRLFRQVDLFIEYFRDTAGYEKYYGISRERFRYIPFKVNRHERVLATPVRDDGYIFCGGNTRRDFGTLIDAVRDLPYPVRVVTMDERVIAGHGSSLDERALPANVQVVRHDGSDSFLDHIAGARVVALPIKRENISASGIGVYLASMALGKCVVISEGPAVNGVVPEGAALIVPPEDPAALRAAIVRAWSDDTLRTSVAAAGQRYARGLGGEERLCESLLDVLLDDQRR